MENPSRGAVEVEKNDRVSDLGALVRINERGDKPMFTQLLENDITEGEGSTKESIDILKHLS